MRNFHLPPPEIGAQMNTLTKSEKPKQNGIAKPGLHNEEKKL